MTKGGLVAGLVAKFCLLLRSCARVAQSANASGKKPAESHLMTSWGVRLLYSREHEPLSWQWLAWLTPSEVDKSGGHEAKDGWS
jgi:hypothetical protein